MSNKYQEQAIKLSAQDKRAEARCPKCGHKCEYCGDTSGEKDDEKFGETNNRSTKELEEKGNKKGKGRREEV